MKKALIWLAALVLVGLLAVDIYLRVGPSLRPGARATPATPSPSAAPSPTATEEPTPEPTVVAQASPVVARPVVKKPAPRRKKPTAEPRQSPAPVSGAELAARRSFVSGATAIDGKEGAMAPVPAGFDAEGVDAKPVPKVPAQVEFEVQPRAVSGGQPYTVKVYLRNQGKKAIKIKELRVVSIWNGTRTESALTPRMKRVPPEQVALVAEIPSIWRADVKTWSMAVSVRADHGETYRNNVDWR